MNRDHETVTRPERVLIRVRSARIDLTRLRPPLGPFRDLDEFVPPLREDLTEDQDVRAEQVNIDLVRERQNVVDAAHCAPANPRSWNMSGLTRDPAR